LAPFVAEPRSQDREHPKPNPHRSFWSAWPTSGCLRGRNLGELIALIHSELSEMLQAERIGEMDKHLPHRLAAEVECADALMRLLI
jgi:hypothetical protein